MDRQDGKDPFDPKTYTSPATIKSMIELRALCAGFFEQYVRGNEKAINEDLIVKFITLITSSKFLYARARAVVPELQPLVSPQGFVRNNPNLQHVLQMTEALRHMPEMEPSKLPEESAWSKLAKDGREQHLKDFAQLSTESTAHKKQAGGDASPPWPSTLIQDGLSKEKDSIKVMPQVGSMSCPAKPDVEEAESTGHDKNGPRVRAAHELPSEPSLFEAPISLRPKLSRIATFVPRNEAGNSSELVWSPTSGTRQRRPEEKYQSTTGDTRTFGEKRPPHTITNVLQSHQPVLPDLDAASTPQKGHGQKSWTDSIFLETVPYMSLPSPLGPNSPSFTQIKADATPKHRVGNLGNASTEELFAFEPAFKTATPSKEFNQSMFENPPKLSKRRSQPMLSESIVPDGPQHPVDRTSGIDETGPSSAPFSKSRFEDFNAYNRGQYVGLESPGLPLQSTMSLGPDARNWDPSIQQPRARSGHGNEPSNISLANQLTRMHLPYATNKPQLHSQVRSLQPRPSIWNPTEAEASVYFKTPADLSGNSGNEDEALIVPPPGNMNAVDYWNLLYHRETSLVARLSAAGVAILPTYEDYLVQLREARIATVVNNKMPARGKLSAASWLQLLENEFARIWEQRPGDLPQSEVVIERKNDYEEGVKRAIQLVLMEIGQIGDR